MRRQPRYVGLKTLKFRVSIDDFSRQLNLDDLFDAAIEMLPGDALLRMVAGQGFSRISSSAVVPTEGVW